MTPKWASPSRTCPSSGAANRLYTGTIQRSQELWDCGGGHRLTEKRVCGVDLDNTIVTYDEVLARIVHERGLLGGDIPATKRAIRDRIRLLPDGEIEWQRCQALLYGPRIHEATLIEGVRQFFQLCARHDVCVLIVSHKTQYSRYDPTGTDLREAALRWMTANRFFESDGLRLTRDRVFFADTRQEKIDCLTRLCCDDFIDDLEETFLEATFPLRTTRILYEPGRKCAAPAGVRLMRSWQEISDYFFRSN